MDSRKGNIGFVAVFFVFVITFFFTMFLVNSVVDLGFDEINDELQSDDILDAAQKDRLNDQYTQSKSLFDNIFVLAAVFVWVISLVVAASSLLPNMFYWVMVILSIIALIIAFPLANSYEEITLDGDLSEFPAKYPKTDHFFNNLHIYVLVYFLSIVLAGFGGSRL